MAESTTAYPPASGKCATRDSGIADGERLLLRTAVILDFKCEDFLKQARHVRKRRESGKRAAAVMSSIAAYFGRGATETIPNYLQTRQVNGLAVAEVIAFVVALASSIVCIWKLLYKDRFSNKDVEVVHMQRNALDEFKLDYVLKKHTARYFGDLRIKLRQIKEELGMLLADTLDPDESWIWEQLRDLSGEGASELPPVSSPRASTALECTIATRLQSVAVD